MKKINYFFLPLVFILSSCYIYKPYSEKEEIAQGDPNQKSTSKAGISVRDTQPAGKLPNAPMNKSLKEGGVTTEMTDEEKQRIKLEEANRNQPPTANNNIPGRTTSEIDGKTAGTPSMTLGRDPNPINTGKVSRDPEPKVALPAGAGLKQKIQPNKYYKITVEEKEYKIQADKWEGDTLVSHILRKPNRVLRFHENQIDEELLKERRFSKAYSDLFTVGAYAAAGAAVLLLIL